MSILTYYSLLKLVWHHFKLWTAWAYRNWNHYTVYLRITKEKIEVSQKFAKLMRNLHLLKVLGTFTAPKLFSAYKPLLYQGFSPFNYIMPPIITTVFARFCTLLIGVIFLMWSWMGKKQKPHCFRLWRNFRYFCVIF